jgi:hypothetical protein
MKNKTATQAIAILFTCLFLSCCRESVIEPLGVNYSLTAADVEVNEMAVRVTAMGKNSYGTLTLTRDGWKIFESPARYHFSIDTVIRDQYLSPKHTYMYKAYYCYNGTPVDSSPPLFVTTLDTTSHAFTWQLFAIGDIGSTISDVAIINDTCVIAVGQIYGGDSLFNIAKWNGLEWHSQVVQYHDYNSTVLMRAPLKAINAISDTDIYVVSSANLLHWNGYQWREKAFFMTSIPFYEQVITIWTADGSNLYCGGRNGALYFVNGTQWQKIESGTTLDIQDIYGSKNEKTGELEVMAVAAMAYQTNRDRRILKITGTTVTAISDSGIQSALTSVWFIPGKKYYVVGEGAFSTRDPWNNKGWDVDPGYFAPSYYTSSVRGNALNDMVIVCDFGRILHFNGCTWWDYGETTQLHHGYFYKVAMKGNIIVAVGDNYNKGIIALGRRTINNGRR